MSELRIAGPGEIYVCGVCGKTFINPYKVDVSCMLNRVLCKEDSLVYDKNGRVIKAEPVEEKGITEEQTFRADEDIDWRFGGEDE